jgi:transcriptional regulator with XRE-family HTH domain
MTPKEIKIILLEKELTIQSLADEFGCRRQELSMCINQKPRRSYFKLREKLAKRLGIPESELFGDDQRPRAA